MKDSHSLHSLLPATVVSLSLLVLVSAVTNPLDNIAFVLIFLGLLAVFIYSLLLTLILLYRGRGRVDAKSGYRIWLLVLIFVAIVMLRSLQGFGLSEAALVILITAIAYFYIGRI